METIESAEQKHAPVKLWAPLDEVEPQALAQLKNTASLPWVFRHVAAMADAHYGIGATVGSVVALKNAVAPAAVGVDIGCGMLAARLNLKASQLPDSLAKLRSELEAVVPVGFNMHKEPASVGVDHLWKEAESLAVQEDLQRARCQLGTLGGGNHFIELCLDSEQNVWLLLHSGSRHIGNVLAQHHMRIARKLAHNAELPDPDLSVFLAGTPEMAAYRHDLYWAQNYAFYNRALIFTLCLRVLRTHYSALHEMQSVSCHHNYVAEETHFGENVFVTRKGAIFADKGAWGIIPGSMGTKSYIVEGLGNADSFNSASHGAGRRMGRGAAKKAFTVEDLAKQTAGVECRKDSGVLDEIPAAYKDIDQVMQNQADLVTIKAELHAVLCIKG